MFSIWRGLVLRESDSTFTAKQQGHGLQWSLPEAGAREPGCYSAGAHCNRWLHEDEDAVLCLGMTVSSVQNTQSQTIGLGWERLWLGNW